MESLNWTHIFILLASVGLCAVSSSSFETFQKKIIVNSSELSIIPISPQDFDWTRDPGSVNEITYTARISQYPDLPEWLHYTYDGLHSVGYVYGVPPKRVQTMNLDVIAWNFHNNSEVRRLVVSMDVLRMEKLEFVVELKIDNLDVRDLCNSRRMVTLLNVLKEHLGWTQIDGSPVVPTFLASAVETGDNRIPLRPNDAGGLIIHLSSDKDFSPELKKLQQEVASLWKMRPCPRDMKRTSVERHFRQNKFLVDWCSFRLTTVQHWNGDDDDDDSSDRENLPHHPGGKDSGDLDEEDSSSETLGENPELSDDQNQKKGTLHVGKGARHHGIPEVFIFKENIPERGYGIAALFSCVIPAALGGLIGFLLIVLLWVDREDDAPICGRPRDEDEWDIRPSDNVVIVTRPDDQFRDNLDDSMDDNQPSTPLPPQYGVTHPDGTPALTYAV